VTPRFNISAGEVFELIRPVVVVISILLSAWVLASARKRFSTLVAFAWTIGTLLLPLVVLPVYLAVIVIWQWPVRSRRWRWALPLAYCTILLAGVGMFIRHENATVDAHLAKAAQAKLLEDHATAINEYRTALTIENDPHTHKLLALELMQAGYLREAISEFRLAQQGSEPDDLIHYYLGLVFERLDLKDQAKVEFEKFLLSTTCAQEERKCEEAREGIRRLGR
jgi:MFS family permease